MLKAPDHVIAIPPGKRFGGVALVAVGLGVPYQVEPVPRPAFAVRGPCEQVVDEFLDRVGVSNGRSQKGIALFGVGGRPVTSRNSRRAHARGPAGAAGASPFSSSLASTNRSIGLRTQPPFVTRGTGNRLIA